MLTYWKKSEHVMLTWLADDDFSEKNEEILQINDICVAGNFR